MKLTRFCLLAAAASVLASTLPLRAHSASNGPAPVAAQDRFEQEFCGGHLTRVRGEQLQKALRGRRIHFARDPGVCPGGFVVRNWSIELLPDGHYSAQADHRADTGRYRFKDDQLCLGDDSPPNCASLYRDAAGRVYAFGLTAFNSEPEMLDEITLSGR